MYVLCLCLCLFFLEASAVSELTIKRLTYQNTVLNKEKESLEDKLVDARCKLDRLRNELAKPDRNKEKEERFSIIKVRIMVTLTGINIINEVAC